MFHKDENATNKRLMQGGACWNLVSLDFREKSAILTVNPYQKGVGKTPFRRLPFSLDLQGFGEEGRGGRNPYQKRSFFGIVGTCISKAGYDQPDQFSC